jgi:hypothetical protein
MTFGNTKKDQFLESIPTVSLDDYENNHTERSKYNFSYFDNSQNAGQDFSDLTQSDLTQLFNKLKEYSKFTLAHWQTTPMGKHHHVLEIYGNFPTKTDFKPPSYIPHQAQWARFRLKAKERLIGFVIPESYHDNFHERTGLRFDKNTFYIVFLDMEHKFYKTEKR